MNILKKLEEVKRTKPYYGFANLATGYHPIESFRVVKNKFSKKGVGSNKSILAELKDQVIFLPQYFWDKLSENDINELNSCLPDEKIYLFFGGKLEPEKPNR